MKVLVTGGTGLIGPSLIKALSHRGDEVVALTRNLSGPAAQRLGGSAQVQVQTWPAPAELAALMERVDAVVNLAGEPVNRKRWTPEHRRAIHDSRVQTTRGIFDAIRAAKHRPSVVVNASAVGYYGFHGSEPLTESASGGTDFLATVCRDWEAATEPSPEGVRVVLARIGVVFAREGGALAEMVRPFKLFGGGPIGDGSQWVSWVHLDDVVGLLVRALDAPEIRGPLNVTAPEAVTSKELSKLIGKVLHRPSWLPVPKFALKVAVGDIAEVLVTGQRVVPDVALNVGYQFKHPQCEEALQSVLT